MPIVPRYGSSQQVADAPLQGAPQRSSVSPALLSTGVQGVAAASEGLGNAGTMMARIGIDMQTRENADQVFAGSAAARNTIENYSQQAMQRMGTDAKGLLDETDTWWQDQSKEILDGATNPIARQALEREIAPMRATLTSQVGRHEATQRRASIEKSAAADIESAINAAAAHPNDPRVQQNARDTIDRDVGAVGVLNGATAEMVKAEKSAQFTKLHLGIIAAQVDTHPEAATEYYKANIDEIAGTEHAKIEKMLSIGGLKVRSQAAAADIISRAANESEAIELAQNELSGDEEDAALTRINYYYAQRDQALSRQHRDASDRVFKAYDQGGIAAVSSADAAAMDPQAWVQFKEYDRNRAKQNEADIVTDTTKYREMLTMAAENPAQFTAQDPNTWRRWANTGDRNKLMSLWEQTTIAKGKPARNVLTMKQHVDKQVSQFGLVGKENVGNAGYISTQYYNALMDAQTQSPTPEKPLTDLEVTGITDRVTRDILDRDDPRRHPVASAASTKQIDTMVSTLANTIVGENKEGALTAKRNTFKDIARQVLTGLRTKYNGQLDDATARAAIAKLLRQGQIDGSGVWDDDRGYYFEFLDHKGRGNFIEDQP